MAHVKTNVPHRLNGVLTHLRQAIDARGANGPTDAELLQSFARTGNSQAFELLVWRHGAMVLHACRRMLARPEDAEDAFQATFLALVRRAKAIRQGEAVAGWLHTVACRVALRARAAAARRSAEVRAWAESTPPATAEEIDPATWAEVRAVLDAEVNRLSAKLRAPVVLCYLEGLTNEEAARQLGVPKGTVLSRLARARDKLRDRLARRGLTLPATALTAALIAEANSWAAPTPLVVSTLQAAALVAAGQATAGAVSAPVLSLMEGALHAMFMSKLKVVTAVVVGVSILGLGAGGFWQMQPGAGRAVAQQPRTASQPATDPAPTGAENAKITNQQKMVDELLLSTLRKADLEQQIRSAEVDLERLRAQHTALEEHLRNLRHLHRVHESQQKPKPASSKPSANIPSPVSSLPALPAGASTDFIQVGTAYIDALRDVEIAKAKLSLPVPGQPQVERLVERANLTAAERKAGLLRSIIEGSLKDARATEERAQKLASRNYISGEERSRAESNVRLLQLILDSAK